MAKYKIILNDKDELTGVQTVRERDGAVLNIPASEDNRDWRQYLEWVAEGNTPDPMYTPEEEAENAIRAEIGELKDDMRKVLIGQFDMLMALFDVGKDKGVWDGPDFDPALIQKVQNWKTKIARLKELGEDE
jgi:hypothetical protein